MNGAQRLSRSGVHPGAEATSDEWARRDRVRRYPQSATTLPQIIKTMANGEKRRLEPAQLFASREYGTAIGVAIGAKETPESRCSHNRRKRPFGRTTITGSSLPSAR